MFTEAQQKELAQSPYILSVSNTTIRYSEEFKYIFSALTTAGNTAEEIVRKLGLDPELLGPEQIRNMKRNYTNYKPIQEELLDLQALRKQHEKLLRQKEILEAENRFLKKLNALSMGDG